ncbi:MAG: exosome complex protein Rrp42 [archaeon]
MIAKEYIVGLAKKGFRNDGRDFSEYRAPVTVEYGISGKAAEGSAKVTIGDTIVIAGVKVEIGTPYPDTPDKGTIMVNAELTPLSSSEYESGPPTIDSIELARVVDRGIRESHAIDFKKLCITPKEKMWIVCIDIYSINANGNLFDASALAALAALKDAKFPAFDGETIDYKNRTKDGLPLNKLPLACTVWRVGDKLLVDPTRDEELASDARLTIAFTEEDEICAMQKGGERAFSDEEVENIITIASEKAKMLREAL